MNREIITPAEAKAKGLKRYFTGRPCAKGHIAERSVKGRSCVLCDRERCEIWRQTHPDRQSELVKSAKEAKKAKSFEAYRARRKKHKKAWMDRRMAESLAWRMQGAKAQSQEDKNA